MNKGILLLVVIGGNPDRRFRQATTRVVTGISTCNSNVYFPINSSIGKVYLNNNLGADYNNMSSPGVHLGFSITLSSMDVIGYCWSTTLNDFLHFAITLSVVVSSNPDSRSAGVSVRCLKD